MGMKHNWRRRAARMLLLAGGLAVAQGLYIPAKAVLAQQLMAQAWSRAQHGEVQARPWAWADTWPVARLQVPRLRVDQFVLSDSSGRSLAFGPGLLDSADGLRVIAGHRDTHFRWLQVLQPDDRLELEYADGRRLHFAVLRQEVHDAAETELALTGDFAETLVLVSCYPFDAIAAGGSLRYVVVARALPQPLPETGPKQYLL